MNVGFERESCFRLEDVAGFFWSRACAGGRTVAPAPPFIWNPSFNAGFLASVPPIMEKRTLAG